MAEQPVKKISNRERTIFYLKRRLRALEAQITPQHETMAQQRMTYAERQEVQKQVDRIDEATKVEREVFKELIEFVEGL